jgi:hypothetical protein
MILVEVEKVMMDMIEGRESHDGSFFKVFFSCVHLDVVEHLDGL